MGGEMRAVSVSPILGFGCQKDDFSVEWLTVRLFEKLRPGVKRGLCEVPFLLRYGLGLVKTHTGWGRCPSETRLLRGVCGVDFCLKGGLCRRKVPFALCPGGCGAEKIVFFFLFQMSVFCYRAGC